MWCEEIAIALCWRRKLVEGLHEDDERSRRGKRLRKNARKGSVRGVRDHGDV